jgi:hypothetical protein
MQLLRENGFGDLADEFEAGLKEAIEAGASPEQIAQCIAHGYAKGLESAERVLGSPPSVN